MDHERFRDWFSHVDDLTAAQREEVAAAPVGTAAGCGLAGDDRTWRGQRAALCGTAAAAVLSLGARRAVCAAIGARPAGRHSGALTGTALSGLHHKERWLSFGESLAEGETIRASAARCGIAPSTAHRWRHRFLEAVRQAPDRLAGIVEADETFVLESRKGERKLNRKPRRRGGKARKRGPLARAGADPGRRRSHRRDPQPHPACPRRRQREGGAGAGHRSGCLARLGRQRLLSARRCGAHHPS